MKLLTLGSSSRGNGYILQSDTGECLIVEAGVKLNKVLQAINFNLSCIVGCIASHLHQDHSAYLSDYADKSIHVYANEPTLKSKGIENHHYSHPVQAKQRFDVGSFFIYPFELRHDVPCLGYLINHPESGSIAFITDTFYVPYKFAGMNNILVECNYSLAILQDNIEAGIPLTHKNRVLKSHMELSTVKDFLLANDLSKVANIVLLHMSSGNSNAEEFKKEITEVVGGGKEVYVAEEGLVIDLNAMPF
jgi:phosphoribosyl 1,2-cyclic phosphodiesterase